MAATTIDEVIREMEALIKGSIDTGSRLGFFAALYHKVTVRVKEGILNNEFEDPVRMERLDVVFANRYLEAVACWESKKQPTGPWQVTFEATEKPVVLLLQHLLLGMNAHINLDLGIAAADSAGAGDLQALQKDFNSINAILGSMIFEVLTELNYMSPLLSLTGLHANNPAILIQFSITNARDGAWAFAEELHGKLGVERERCIAARADTIRRLGESLRKPRGLLAVTRLVIWLFEWKRARRITRRLNASKKKFVRL